MKSITIHGIDETLDKLIREKAKAKGISLSKTIKTILEESLGLKSNNEANKRLEFLDLFGSWTEKDLQGFNKNIQDFNKIDPEDWE